MLLESAKRGLEIELEKRLTSHRYEKKFLPVCFVHLRTREQSSRQVITQVKIAGLAKLLLNAKLDACGKIKREMALCIHSSLCEKSAIILA